IPLNAAGLIEYKCHPYWYQKYCPSHEYDNTARVSRNEKYYRLDDGRILCFECMESAITDTGECQPLYHAIRDYYEGMNMRIDQQVPMLLVGRDALNEAIVGEKNVHRWPRMGGHRFIGMRTQHQKLTRKCEVTTILILYGLPRYEKRLTKTALLLSKISPKIAGEPIEAERLYDVVKFCALIAENEKQIFDAILEGKLDLESAPLPSISVAAKDLIRKMLAYEPKKRITASAALEHPWMKEGGEASDKPIDNAILSRMKQFRAMNKMKKLALKVIAQNLSEEEIKGLKQMFNNMDTDRSGVITFEELKSGLSQISMNKCNVGYAFINMLSASHIIPFYETFNGKKWEKFNSEKVASLAYARIQGKAALVNHFQNSISTRCQ
ncbi:hypothetical protein S83_036007, partial [Arachis hypogaea]